MSEVFKLSAEFNDCLEEMESGADHLVITGKAGTGKSTLLDLFRRTTTKKTVILAPTGIAALRVHGQTIHSFFKLPPRLILPGDLSQKPALIRLCKQIEILVVDEISMVRADVMDAIDTMLKIHRRNNMPFGGVRLILFGDLYQLPPIVSSREENQYFSTVYPTPFFFSANAWLQLENIHYINLQKVYRQTDRNFVRLLDQIRHGIIDYDELAELNERVDPEFEDDVGYLHLSPRNATVQRINQNKLAGLLGFQETYLGSITGVFNPSVLPTDLSLTLKEGAQVIFIRNDVEKKFVNGTIGIVKKLAMDRITVMITQTGQLVEVSKATWEMIHYKIASNQPDTIAAEVVGTFEQFPLKLAWAMSIHKSQGQTFDQVILDMEGGAFETGQTYVALSRCRSLERLVLKRPLRMNDIRVDERVQDFYLNNFR